MPIYFYGGRTNLFPVFRMIFLLLCGKFHFRITKSSTKFHFKVRKPYFKLWKALFKWGLEIYVKNKNVLEFDVEKDSGIIFFNLSQYLNR